MRHRHYNEEYQKTLDQKKESPKEESYDKKEEPIVLSKITSDIILNKNPDKGIVQKYPADLMALYWFYYYAAKWQGTNKPKSTTSFAAKGLKWSEDRVRRTKKQLIELGLIEDITSRNENTNKITGHYIYVKFIWWDKNKIESHTLEKPEGGKSQRVENSEGNALSTINKNALSTINSNALNNNYILFLDEWNKNKIIIHKKITSKKRTAIKKALKDYTQEEIFKAFQNYATAINSPDYFFSYRWTIEDFLQRGLHKFVDEACPLDNKIKTFKDDPQQTDIELSPAGFPLIDHAYPKINVLSKDRRSQIPKTTIEDWQGLLEGHAKRLLNADIWSPNYRPRKIAVFNGVVSMQEWLEKVDYSVDGGANLRLKIRPLNELITYYILCIDDWWGGWMDGVKDNVFDVNNKIFKMFIREMETSFSVRMHIKSEGWVNNSDWEPRD